MIAQAVLEQIAAQVAQTGPNTATLMALRAGFPGIHFTYCLDDDIHSGRAAVSRDGFNLYLVDSSDHCLSLTTALEHATGIVMAEVVDDD